MEDGIVQEKGRMKGRWDEKKKRDWGEGSIVGDKSTTEN